MRRVHHRRCVVLIAPVAISTALLGACGSSGPAAQPTAPAVNQQAATTPTTTPTTAAPPTSVATTPAATEPTTTTTAVTEVDVADLEKQLDEIDQLLAGVQSDLSQD
jgi:hypothetical protein